MKHRWLNRLYARVYGYFWLPCPICKQPFGGHEWMLEQQRQVTAPGDPAGGWQCVCSDCSRANRGTHIYPQTVDIERWRALRQ